MAVAHGRRRADNLDFNGATKAASKMCHDAPSQACSAGERRGDSFAAVACTRTFFILERRDLQPGGDDIRAAGDPS